LRFTRFRDAAKGLNDKAHLPGCATRTSWTVRVASARAPQNHEPRQEVCDQQAEIVVADFVHSGKRTSLLNHNSQATANGRCCAIRVTLPGPLPGKAIPGKLAIHHRRRPHQIEGLPGFEWVRTGKLAAVERQ
jgi:hypothetical protein